ncbi:MAG TPA: cation transporter, partial [Pyrinomonadaceae bacterium]
MKGEVKAEPRPLHPAEAGGGLRVELPLTGMTCAACARRIERRLQKAEGVSAASVNFATERASVEYDPARTGLRRLVRVVEDVGYGVSELPASDSGDGVGGAEPARSAERRDLRRRFTLAALLSLPLLALSMSHGAVEAFEAARVNWLQLALAAPVVLYCGAPFFRNAWAALRHGAADMNTLIATGTGAAFAYSAVATAAPRLVAPAHTVTASGARA